MRAGASAAILPSRCWDALASANSICVELTAEEQALLVRAFAIAEAGMVMRAGKPVQRMPERRSWELLRVFRSRMAMSAAHSKCAGPTR